MIDNKTGKSIVGKELELDPGVTQPIHLNQIVGLFQTVNAAPTLPPRFIQDQIKIYANGATWKLYIWDNVNQIWKSVTLT